MIKTLKMYKQTKNVPADKKNKKCTLYFGLQSFTLNIKIGPRGNTSYNPQHVQRVKNYIRPHAQDHFILYSQNIILLTVKI